MSKVDTDVDIDCFNRDVILEKLDCVFARIDRPGGIFDKHNTGVYFQGIPRDPITNISTIDHHVAMEYGYFKIDFLNVNMYEGVRDEEHLLRLLHTEPQWDLLAYEEITDKLFHLVGHHKLLVKYKPKSVEDLAMLLAIIRPAKAYLQQAGWNKIREEVWVKKGTNDQYFFKRSHSISYALAIVINLNLLVEQLSRDS